MVQALSRKRRYARQRPATGTAMTSIPGLGLDLHAIPILDDNYVWLLADQRHAVLVDPGDADPVIAWLRDRDLAPTAILVTHHHGDHVGGLAALRAAWPALRCHAPPDARIADADVDVRVRGGDAIDLEAPALALRVLDLPGHTRSHVGYVADGVVFCGDTLFSAGCGRLFEGTPAQLLASLDVLAALPGPTQVCCTHEYTQANCRFALAVDADNPDLAAASREADQRRAAGLPTLPSSIGRERRINPFLNVDRDAIRLCLQRARGLPRAASRVEAFAALRQWKDGFRG